MPILRTAEERAAHSRALACLMAWDARGLPEDQRADAYRFAMTGADAPPFIASALARSPAARTPAKGGRRPPKPKVKPTDASKKTPPADATEEGNADA